jgi:Rieske Fe-S protein
MERKEFLRSLGAGAAFALTFPCLQGCSKDEDSGEMTPIPTGVDFTIDLNSAEAANLADNGGFILAKSKPELKSTDIVVVKNLEGNFIAASQICSHLQTEAVRFIEDDGGIFNCSSHGSQFDQTGQPLNSVTNNPLKIFQTALNGDILRVFE